MSEMDSEVDCQIGQLPQSSYTPADSKSGPKSILSNKSILFDIRTPMDSWFCYIEVV